jgi:hypothetical protein
MKDSRQVAELDRIERRMIGDAKQKQSRLPAMCQR